MKGNATLATHFFINYIVAMNNEKKTERIAYGFNRGDNFFRPYNVDRVFLDTSATKRAQRYELLHQLGLRPGDTIVVWHERDLGRGVELRQIREFLAEQGVNIEAVGTSNGATKAKVRGMSDEAAAIAKPYWVLPGCSIDFINAQLEKEGHGPFTRQQMIYKLGNRGTYKDRDG